MQPMEPHVHGLSATGDNGVVYHDKCRGVDGLYLRQGLPVAHRNEGVPGGNHFSAIDVESAKFCLGGGGHDGLNYLGDGQDAAVIGRTGRFI